MNKKHLIIALFLLVSIVLISFKTVFAQDTRVLVYSEQYVQDSTKQRAVNENDIVIAENELLGQGIPIKDIVSGLEIDLKIYTIYNKVVYGFPSFDDMKPNEFTGRLEFRYLGITKTGIKITNDLFPNDATSGKALKDKNWIVNDPNLVSWGDYAHDPKMITYILTTTGIVDDGIEIEQTISDILQYKGSGLELMKYIKVLSFPTLRHNGSVQLKHQT